MFGLKLARTAYSCPLLLQPRRVGHARLSVFEGGEGGTSGHLLALRVLISAVVLPSFFTGARVGLVYERGDKSPYEEIAFVSYPVA